jgi:hypothetical protein
LVLGDVLAFGEAAPAGSCRLASAGSKKFCPSEKPFKDALEALDDRMTVMLGVLEQGMRSVGVDVALYSKPQRQFLRLLVETASYLKTMLETPILDEDGRLNPALSGAIQTAYLVNARAMAGAAS